MDQISRWNSLKWKMGFYLIGSVVLAFQVSILIGVGTNRLQELYQERFYNDENSEIQNILAQYEVKIQHGVGDDIARYILYRDEKGVEHVVSFEPTTTDNIKRVGYILLSYAQVLLIPLAAAMCIVLGNYVFYKREIEGGLKILLDASDHISNNELDFCLPQPRPNEIGLVCRSFERMRESLLETSLRNIRMVTESKRLNAAFSHDIRTPITVLKGYVDFLNKYLPEGKVNREKQREIMDMMSSQVLRLENYAISMSSVQKLEDRQPQPASGDYRKFLSELEYSCKGIDERLQFEVQGEQRERITMDQEMVFEVVENLVANASRYARQLIRVRVSLSADVLNVSVLDDGAGFSRKILEQFGRPFLREDGSENENHFGLGIYIAKMLCEKCGGEMRLENRGGAFVQVYFKIDPE